jgi:thiol-disulfide isomerase/thioredoxin
MKALTYLLPLFATVAFAADESASKPAEKAGPSLKPGDTVSVDALKSAKWIRGEAPEAWEPGKLYIIECWATWCGPCRGVIPHMNELYKNREKDGLGVVGMNVW